MTLFEYKTFFYVLIMLGFFTMNGCGDQTDSNEKQSLNTSEAQFDVPKVKDEPVRILSFEKILEDLPRDDGYYVVSGEFLKIFEIQLRGHLVRIDCILQEDLRYPYKRSSFESRDRNYSFPATWAFFSDKMQRELRSGLFRYKVVPSGTRFRLYGRWEKGEAKTVGGVFADSVGQIWGKEGTSWLKIDNLQMVEW